MAKRKPKLPSDEDVKRHLAANLTRIMEARGLSVRDVEATGACSHMAVSHYRAGQKLPNAALLLRLAISLEVTTDELLAPPR